MSRTLIKPAQAQREATALLAVKGFVLITSVMFIFSLGAWYQRAHSAVGHYCTQDMQACWYEVDFF